MSDFENQTLALSYAALLLRDSELEISSANLQKVASAAGVTVQGAFANTFAKSVSNEFLDNLTEKLTTIGAAGPATGASSGGATEEVAEEEEEEESSSDAGLGGLF